MKHKKGRKLLSLMLAVAMVIGMILSSSAYVILVFFTLLFLLRNSLSTPKNRYPITQKHRKLLIFVK